MEWRYVNTPRHYDKYGVYDENLKLDAWCVTTTLKKGNKIFGYYNVGIIVDFCVNDTKKGKSNGEQLISSIINLFNENKNNSLALVLTNKDEKYSSIFKRFFSLPDKYSPKEFPIFVKYFDNNFKKTLKADSLWSIFFSDYDIV